ncbi:MAG TPA: IclR family transcriptional regulator [Paenibacillus sp.]|nr:IclR family transcriptional regulator [Paenibacillus sp.]
MKKQYSVPALEKSIAILELLAQADQEYTVTEIHVALDIPKATVFMILNVMEAHHLVSKDAHGQYTLGPKIYSLGMGYMTKMELKKIARPYMEELVKETGFTSHLGRFVDNHVIFIEKAEPPNSFIKFNTYPGMRSDFHNSALGKAMAAHMDPATIDAVIASVGLGQYTPNTITDPDKFKAALTRIREIGYAIEDEEGEIGVRCIGAPIFDLEGKVAGAVSITALKSELTTDLFPSIGNKVANAAKEISKALGFSGSVAEAVNGR